MDPDAYKAVLGLERYVQDGVLPSGLVHLVKIRASELNGCAFCLDMHHREARADGETQRRLDVMSAWREVPSLFTDRERAALALTEEVTRIGDAGVTDAGGTKRAACSTRLNSSHCSWRSPPSTCGTGSP